MLIGITGKAGTGKDTFADLIVDSYAGKQFSRYAFAAPIKKMLEAGFGLTPDVWENRDLKEKPLNSIGKSPGIRLKLEYLPV